VASPEQRRRQSAQRANARRLSEARRSHRPVPKTLPRAVSAARERAEREFARRVATGEHTPQNNLERKQAARLGAYAAQGKINPAFYAALSQYFYHDELHKTGPDEYELGDYEDEDEDEEEE
jgi:hypothetical protein